MASITWNKKGKNKNWRETVFAFSASMLSEWCLKVTQSEEDFFFFHFLSVIGCCTWHSWARHWGCGRVRFPGQEACVRSRAFFILFLLSSFVVIRLSYKVSIFSVFFFSCAFCIFSVFFFTGISFMFSFYFYIVFTIFVVQVLASKSFPCISCLRLSLDIFTCFQIFSSFFLPLYLIKLISSFFFVFLFGLYYFCFVLLYVPLISCYALLLFFFICHFPL